MKNMKGERCPYDDLIFCQEGMCEGCGVYIHYSAEKYKKMEEEEALKTLDELLCSVKINAYQLGYENGYEEGYKAGVRNEH